MKFKDHIAKFKRRQIIYAVLTIILVAILVFYLIIRFTPNNFLSVAYTNNPWLSDDAFEDPTDNTLKNFLSRYIDAFFIYLVVTLLLLWLTDIVLHIVKERISPDIHNTLHVLARVLIIPIFIIAYISKFEAFTGAVIGVAATLGAVFALAVSRSANDLISGLYMVFSKHHNVGDYIRIPTMDIEGVVKSISINYTTILEQNGVTAVIPNSKLKEHEILNTIVIHIEKELDSIDDLILFGKRVTETIYIYPALWAVSSAQPHQVAVEAIKQTADQYKDYVDQEIQWRINKRDRLNREYEVLLTVLDPNRLLTLPGEFLKTLESNYQEKLDAL